MRDSLLRRFLRLFRSLGVGALASAVDFLGLVCLVEVLGLEAGVYRYVPAGHRLVRHGGGDARGAVARAALLQRWIADAPAILVLVGFTERSAAKYGDRAPRYVHMEVGHAAQNVYLQAEALGLGTCVVGAFHDGQLKRVLALPEAAAPLALLPVGTPR